MNETANLKAPQAKLNNLINSLEKSVDDNRIKSNSVLSHLHKIDDTREPQSESVCTEKAMTPSTIIDRLKYLMNLLESNNDILNHGLGKLEEIVE